MPMGQHGLDNTLLRISSQVTQDHDKLTINIAIILNFILMKNSQLVVEQMERIDYMPLSISVTLTKSFSLPGFSLPCLVRKVEVFFVQIICPLYKVGIIKPLTITELELICVFKSRFIKLSVLVIGTCMFRIITCSWFIFS